MSSGRRILMFVPMFLALVTACAEPALLTAPLDAPALTTQGAGATRTHAEFDVFDSFDIVLSCLPNETTHFEGPVHVTFDAITTPSGATQERISVAFGDGYFVERENGVRYYPVGPFPINEHHLFGPVTVIAGTAAGAWRSADGDVIAFGFHVQLVYDKDGNPVLEKWTGACP